MGLDLTLGGLMLFLGLRGWFKGFVLQAVRLAGAVACVYLADPVRDRAKPHVMAYLPSIRADLVDRGLWWCSAVVSYVVLVGVASLIVKAYRRRPVGEYEAYRNDQFAGFLFGLVKGFCVAALLAAGIHYYALDHINQLPWGQQQAQSSRALRWTERYQPVAKVWAMPPVRHFVNHIQRMGLQPPTESAQESAPVATAEQAPKLELRADDAPTGNGKTADRAATARSRLDTSGLDPDFAKQLQDVDEALEKLAAPK